MKTIDLIIPAYNEQYRIRATLEDYCAHLPDAVFLTIVINNTTDRTRGVVEEVQRQFPGRINIIEEKGFTDKGGAIKLGWKEAAREYVGFVDADGATSAQEFKKLIKAMEDYDGVIASRLLPGSKVIDRESQLRRWASKMFIWLVRSLFSLPFVDYQCGAKLFTREVIEDVMPYLQMNDMTFDVDLLWNAHNRGWKIGEVPTVWFDKPGSAALDKKTAFIKTGWRMFLSLMKLYRNKPTHQTKNA